ncbi:sodium-independent sulfate anion transporter-like [Topomyia yanbarensis]|uniref:sodium-independent sulfate anion transporter-like n=1 Tax=Topomyia yanbarensis TaxID=2498891 RepID=UPI00273C258C|nr:sodium-independent sulfate anion transporter-like [Topomyia yanbarensis]
MSSSSQCHMTRKKTVLYNYPSWDRCWRADTGMSAFLTGCLVMLGLFNLGFLVHCISVSVTGGFTWAAAVTISSGQVQDC